MSEFWKSYRSPKWQKRRLEIMQRDGFKCKDCKCEDDTLNVHHTVYIKGRDVWDYEDDYLVCLCESCHIARHSYIDSFRYLSGLTNTSLVRQVLGYLVGVHMMQNADYKMPPSDDYIFLCGLADAYGIHSTHLERIMELQEIEGGLSFWGIDEFKGRLADEEAAREELLITAATQEPTQVS